MAPESQHHGKQSQSAAHRGEHPHKRTHDSARPPEAVTKHHRTTPRTVEDRRKHLPEEARGDMASR
eukprot:2490631-Alexandrium_andersonii.AAC.1